MAKKLVCIIGSLSVSAAVISPMVNRPTSQKYTCSENEIKELNISKAIGQARKLIFRVKNEVGAPGIIVGVSVDGKVVWKEGIGYADLENEVEAHDETVMRIASISKSLTAAVVGRLWQEGIIDIDKPIQKYAPTFPEKFYENEKVVITTRQLMCHLSGIRHYSKKKKDDSVAAGDGQLEEFYSKERYENVEKALSIFKDDDLLHSPGSKFLYTTYGWTVVSAVMEGATGKTYPQLMRAFLREIGMRRTYLDEPEPIIYGRSKCYSRNKKGRIVNSPYVDNSCKWAGGGFLSTVGDLLKFANAMLYAFQSDGDIDISKVSSRVQTSTIEEKAEVVEQKQSTVKESSLKITDHETGEKIEESKASQGETDSYVRSGVSSIVKGLGDGGSYVWRVGTSLINKEKSESASKESEVKSDARLRETGDKIEQKGETDSYVRSGVSSIVKGLGDGGSYVWRVGTSLINKEKSESASKQSEVKSGAHVRETGDKIEQKGETDSYIRSGVSSIVKGLGDGGSYVWRVGTSLINKEKSESASKESEVKSDARLRETGDKIEQKGETDSYVRSGVSSIVKGLGDGGSYVWRVGTSLINKEKSESASKESEVKSGAHVQETGEKIVQKDETDSRVQETGNKIEESKVAEVESDSYIRSGASSIMNGIGKGGSYVWGLTSSMLSKERSESSNKENSVETQSPIKSSLSSVGSTASYVWKKLTFSSDKKDLSSTQKSDSIPTEEEKQSLIELLGNWFKPKALDNAEQILRTHWEEDETLSSLSPELEGGIGFWFDVLPYAAGVLLGQMPRKTTENQSDLEELEKFNGVRNPYDSNTMNFSIKNPYVLPGTVAKLWTRVEGTRLSDWGPHVEGGYGLGFGVAQAIDSAGGVPDGGQPYIVGHTGGAVGASSAMIIVPRKCNEEKPPKGVAVVLLTNLQAVSLNPLAIEIARIFANVVT